MSTNTPEKSDDLNVETSGIGSPEQTPDKDEKPLLSKTTISNDSRTIPFDTSDTEKVDFESVKMVFNLDNERSPNHYKNIQSIGIGGVGAVFSGEDPALGREVAIKLLRSDFRDNPQFVKRFVREARATAQIEHPNIIPVHEIGIMKDTGIYFTMKKISGETLGDVITELKNRKNDYQQKYSRALLLDIFIDACQGIAFAHSKGIIHRDLKPDNIIIGNFGEVLVLDWGLVRRMKQSNDLKDTEQNPDESNVDLDPDTIPPSVIKDMQTQDGAISGTPQFMSPEQASGDLSEIDYQSDIYCLGAILYQILTYDPPFSGTDLKKMLDDVIQGKFAKPRKKNKSNNIPKGLEAICLKAMALNKFERYKSVGELIEDVRSFKEHLPVSAYTAPWFVQLGKLCLRHRIISTAIAAVIMITVVWLGVLKLAMYVRYKTIVKAAAISKEQGDIALQEAENYFKELNVLRSGRLVKDKTKREQELEKLLRNAETVLKTRYDNAFMLYRSVPLVYKRDPQIFKACTEIMRDRIDYSLLTKNYTDTANYIELSKMLSGKNFEQLPPDERKYLFNVLAHLRGNGELKITTIPVSADVTLYVIKENKDGILEEVEPEKLGKAPIFKSGISPGSYLLVIKARNSPAVRYPLLIGRDENTRIKIYIPNKLPEETVYVPAGKFYSGGVGSRYFRLHEEQTEGFFIRKYEVTFKEYLKFWRSLVDEEKKKRYMSRIRFSMSVRMFYNAWDKRGNLIPQLKADRPVVGITKEAADAYCLWLSRRTGRKIRLPKAKEWEKAARGADARKFVWGNKFQKKFCFIRENNEARKCFGNWAPPGSFPVDISVYGVYDMGGNVREWTADKFAYESLFYMIKGGSSSTTEDLLYCSSSSNFPVVPSDVGFRYVISLDQKNTSQ